MDLPETKSKVRPKKKFARAGYEASNRGAAVEADAIGEQQPKRTRSGAAAEADASGEHAAAAEAGAIGEQQLKRMQSGQGAALAVQSPTYRKSIHACTNLFTTASMRNAEHFRKYTV